MFFLLCLIAPNNRENTNSHAAHASFLMTFKHLVSHDDTGFCQATGDIGCEFWLSFHLIS